VARKEEKTSGGRAEENSTKTTQLLSSMQAEQPQAASGRVLPPVPTSLEDLDLEALLPEGGAHPSPRRWNDQVLTQLPGLQQQACSFFFKDRKIISIYKKKKKIQ
jgi:hypothetical protein